MSIKKYITERYSLPKALLLYLIYRLFLKKLIFILPFFTISTISGLGAVHINSFQFISISIHFNIFQYISIYFNSFQYISIHFNIFQFISIYFNPFQFISIHSNFNSCIEMSWNILKLKWVEMNWYGSSHRRCLEYRYGCHFVAQRQLSQKNGLWGFKGVRVRIPPKKVFKNF